MIVPTFFIVGAPKCGTTSLSMYLREHPNVFIPRLKEPHFFAPEFYRHSCYYVTTRKQYASLFSNRSTAHRQVGEASTYYIYSDAALTNIRRYNDRARIIVLLRNPVEMVYAYHAQLVFSLYESERTFEKAWFSQLHGNFNSLRISNAKVSVLYRYADIGRLSSRLEYLLSIFPPSRVLTLLFDDLCSDPESVYATLLDFLDLPRNERTHYPLYNENRVHRSLWLARANEWLHRRAARLTAPLKSWCGIESLGIIDYWEHILTRKQPRPPLSAEMWAVLQGEFADEIDRLSQIMARDLSHWKEPVRHHHSPTAQAHFRDPTGIVNGRTEPTRGSQKLGSSPRMATEPERARIVGM